MLDVVALGEAVIDFSQCGIGPMGNPAYEMNPGGAPANCVVASARLGAKNAFCSLIFRVSTPDLAPYSAFARRLPGFTGPFPPPLSIR